MDVVNRYLPNKNHQKGVAASVVIIVLLFFLRSGKSVEPATLLSDPFLQLPKQGSVNVVWFTNFEGSEHFVMYGDKKDQRANATTTKLSSMALSETPGAKAKATSVWRHEATASGLEARKRVPYFVESKDGKRNTEVKSKVFSLQPAPQAGQALKILLTSDHQNLPMVAANLQQVDSSIGKLDAVLFAGDTVLVPDRAAEWFGDASHGSAFFPSFQGRAKSVVGTTEYRGGEVLQHAPIFTALGNHDVMGRTNITNTSLDAHFEYSAPRSYAESLYKSTGLDPKSEAHAEWVANNSFNTRTYSEIFSLTGRAPGKLYYSVTLGDVHLIVLCAVRAYRPPTLDPNVASRFSERRQDFNRKELWRHGAFVMEPISKGSAQHVWLQYELKSKEFQSAKYRVVMLHHPIHSLGANIGPAFSNPYPYFKYGADGEVIAASYEYPFPDYLLNDVSPLLEQHGVQLVFYGHSHIWNRFAKPTTTATATMTTNFLESSNVGNTFGAFSTNTGRKRSVVDKLESAQGDPNGLSPVLPTHPNKTAGVGDKDHVSSNTVTVFSILDTDKGTVESYYFDTKHPNSKAQKFDEFSLVKPAAAAVTTPSEPVTTTSTTASARTTEQKPNPLANTKLRAAQVQSVMQPRPEEKLRGRHEHDEGPDAKA
uniref:Calcineurin-like phosphoesterase domain-containing protein n=1 Tax=Eutreptiella gymnastica TaxID=73025 RepID=A0A7S4CDB1_9EUGL